jgi:hypothetical protein
MQDARIINRQELRDRIRQSVEDAVAAETQTEVIVQPQPGVPGFPARPITIATSRVPAGGGPPDIPPRVQETAIAFTIALAAVIILYPLAKAFGRRIDRAPSTKLPTEVHTQLAQLNQAVEAIAVEVERISEGQRFTTKLLSEQQHQLPAASRREP